MENGASEQQPCPLLSLANAKRNSPSFRFVKTGLIQCSSLSLEDSEGLLLQVTSDLSGMAVSFSAFSGQLFKGELLLLLNLKQVHLNGVVTKQNASKSS